MYGIWFIWYMVHIVSGTYGTWYIWYMVHMVYGTYGIWNIWYMVHMVYTEVGSCLVLMTYPDDDQIKSNIV